MSDILKLETLERPDIVAAAKAWIGTPYRHQASAKGAGADCLGLVRGLYREICGPEPEAIPAYTPDWAERADRETLLEGARRCLTELDVDAARPGDVLVFRIRRAGPAKHVGVLSAPLRFIHAYAGHSVCESSLTRWWRARIAAAFAFPGAA